MASMDAVADEILLKILSYLPTKAFLPTAHVSKRFRETWIKRLKRTCTTNPLMIGNLFQSHWNKKPSKLNTTLLAYYVSCGWNNPTMLQKVLREAAARGDIRGMMFLLDRKLVCSNVRDKDICTVAGAAGHLKALQWLRETKQWPWDPTEVMREASENLEIAIMTYVEANTAGYEIQSPSYGDGLPW